MECQQLFDKDLFADGAAENHARPDSALSDSFSQDGAQMSRVNAKQREYLRRRRIYRFCRVVTFAIFIMAALGGGFVAGLFASVAKVLPPDEALADIRPAVPTRILASDGSLLAKIVYVEDRELVPLSRMGYMVNATLAIEDIRFSEHPGIDPRGIMRALVKNIIAGNSKEGASTITQQLARNLYLSREKKITRKIQEVILALQLERRYSKDEILEAYLNQVYYGANSYSVQSWGVQMAARNYFGKDVDKLTLAEAAMVAGLPKNPRDYSPYRYPDAAKKRRAVVLNNMLVYNLINRQQYDTAMQEPIKLAPQKKIVEMADYHAPYFVRYVLKRELPKIFGQDATDMIYHYGLVVYTTLDPRMQRVAENAVKEGVDANKGRRIDEGALISIDPQTGAIKAYVGGMNYRNDQYDVISQGRRQPGSAFKPFVYTTALMRGYTPDTIVYDRPGRYPSGTGQFWSPKNSDGGFRGPMPLKRALWLSRNAAAAGVAYDLGIDSIIKTAYAMGIKHPLEAYLSTSLGASVVVPLEICSAYGTLANGGVHNEPLAVQRVTTPEGEVLYDVQTNRPRARRAIPTNVADTMQEVMEGVIERGTARAARCPFPASGKTGTTNSYRDAWFIGYTDDLVTAVWVGNRLNQPMNRTYGGTVPAPIWRKYMLVAQPIMAGEHKERQDELARINNMPESADLDTAPTNYIIKQQDKEAQQREHDPQEEAPPVRNPRDRFTVNVCADSGDRATSWCPKTVVVTYYKGEQPAPPASRCAIHTNPESVPAAEEQENEGGSGANRGVVISICGETGKIATDKCTLVLRKRFTRNAPTETCPLHGSE